MNPLSESLAIILGAAEWPYHDGFESHEGFRNSATWFRDYLLDKGLPPLICYGCLATSGNPVPS